MTIAFYFNTYSIVVNPESTVAELGAQYEAQMSTPVPYGTVVIRSQSSRIHPPHNYVLGNLRAPESRESHESELVRLRRENGILRAAQSTAQREIERLQRELRESRGQPHP